jgi:hypothetical protein
LQQQHHQQRHHMGPHRGGSSIYYANDEINNNTGYGSAVGPHIMMMMMPSQCQSSTASQNDNNSHGQICNNINMIPDEETALLPAFCPPETSPTHNSDKFNEYEDDDGYSDGGRDCSGDIGIGTDCINGDGDYNGVAPYYLSQMMYNPYAAMMAQCDYYYSTIHHDYSSHHSQSQSHNHGHIHDHTHPSRRTSYQSATYDHGGAYIDI